MRRADNGKHRFSEKEEGGASPKKLCEGGGKRGRKRFLATLEMTAWGMEIPCIIQRMCGKSVLPVSSSRAKARDLFRWRWIRKSEDSGQRETPYIKQQGITVFHSKKAASHSVSLPPSGGRREAITRSGQSGLFSARKPYKTYL